MTPAKVVPFVPRERNEASFVDEIEIPLGAGVCSICRGSGWLRIDAPVGDPNFGRLIPCDCKNAENQAREVERLKRLSNLDAFRDMSFENFNSRLPGLREPYETCLNFARDPNGWLLLFGNFGCGKTHLAAAIANYTLKHMSMRLYFAVVPDLLDYLRATFEPDSTASYDERFDEIRNVPLLILDDLGTESAKPWAREKLYQIINHRYNLKLPTVITTNQDLDHLDGRIRSRIGDAALCKFVLFNETVDFRQIPLEQRSRLQRSPGAEAARPKNVQSSMGQNPRRNYK